MSFESIAQISSEDSTKIYPSYENEIITWAEEDPVFPSGDSAMVGFIKRNLVYPQESVELGQEGIVYVQFDIDKEGYLSNFRVLKGISKLLDDEALRVVKLFPKKWNPYKFAGEYRSTSFTVPINFILRNEQD